MTFKVVVFTEGEFESVAPHATLGEASAFVDGVYCGARAYGAGSVAAYVLPDEEVQMVKEQHPPQVALAREALATQ